MWRYYYGNSQKSSDPMTVEQRLGEDPSRALEDAARRAIVGEAGIQHACQAPTTSGSDFYGELDARLFQCDFLKATLRVALGCQTGAEVKTMLEVTRSNVELFCMKLSSPIFVTGAGGEFKESLAKATMESPCVREKEGGWALDPRFIMERACDHQDRMTGEPDPRDVVTPALSRMAHWVVAVELCDFFDLRMVKGAKAEIGAAVQAQLKAVVIGKLRPFVGTKISKEDFHQLVGAWTAYAKKAQA